MEPSALNHSALSAHVSKSRTAPLSLEPQTAAKASVPSIQFPDIKTQALADSDALRSENQKSSLKLSVPEIQTHELKGEVSFQSVSPALKAARQVLQAEPTVQGLGDLVLSLQKSLSDSENNPNTLKSNLSSALQARSSAAQDLAARLQLTSLNRAELETLGSEIQNLQPPSETLPTRKSQSTIGSAVHAALNSNQPTLVNASKSLIEMQSMRTNIENSTSAIRLDTTVFENINQQIVQEQAELAQINASIQELRPKVSVIGGLLRQQSTVGMTPAVQEAFAKGELPRINMAIAGLGLSVAVQNNGAVTYSQQGKPVSERLFLLTVNHRFDTMNTEVADLTDKMARLRATLSTNQSMADTIGQRLTERIALQQQQIKDYQKKSEQFQTQDMGQLLALRNDPSRWGALSAADRKLVESLITEGKREQGLGSQTLAAAEKAHQQARQQINLHLALRQASEALLAQVEKTLAESELSPDLKADHQHAAAEVQRLVAWANELQNMLNLTPRPETVDVVKMTREWMDGLQTASLKIQELLTRAQQADSLEKTFSEQAIEKLRENLNYHSQQLAQLDARQNERSEHLLRASLRDVAEM